MLGAYDGFFGPGTGSMLILSFVIVFGDSLTRASGNAKVVNLASNLAAFLLFAQRGTILWTVALPMAAANAIGAAVGARLALQRGDRLVRWVVLAVVLAVVVEAQSRSRAVSMSALSLCCAGDPPGRSRANEVQQHRGSTWPTR